ncbi:MAG: hypothetical protein RRZ24_02655 [Clostridia bacterium]
MHKSVYSLVLTDDVVEEIDHLAYEATTSRSNMINQILAEYVSYITPEKRMREVFDRIERMLTGGDVFQLLLQPSDSMFSLRSALSYKYNPTVRYSVELYQNNVPLLGELRVSVRSQNSTLMLTMLQFFKLWTRIEQSYIGATEYATEDGRYVRRFRCPRDGQIDNEAIGAAIAGYIDLFDHALKLYFENLTNPQYALNGVERLYAEYVRNCEIIL